MDANRRPAVAGSFYPGGEEGLRDALGQLFASASTAKGYIPPHFSTLFGLVSPHAGYQYSGFVAARGYALVKSLAPSLERVILIGPNHQGIGSIIASPTSQRWLTPLGAVPVDVEGVKELSRISKMVDLDDLAHEYEHSIEVQLPFLQYVYGSVFKILPICMMSQEKRFAVDLGDSISQIFVPGKDLVVASSDFTHYEPHSVALEKDRKLIERIEELDVDGFYDLIYDKKITVCGFGPIATLMTVSKKLGALGGKLLVYMTSGEVIGEYDQVVGYASIAFGK
ncbi:MAG: MEMO1 family protein [Nitrososphaeria archaeon]